MGDLLLSQWLSNYLVSGFLSTLKLMRISQLYLCGFHLLWSTDPKCKVGTCSCACIKSFKNSSRKPFHSGIKKTVFYEKKKTVFQNKKKEWHCFTLQHISSTGDSRTSSPLTPSVYYNMLWLKCLKKIQPHTALYLEKYLNSLVDHFGRSLVLHQNSSSSSSLRVVVM